MSLSKTAEKRKLTADEFETVGRTHYPALRELTRKELSDLVGALRDHRDKARDISRRQRREMRGKSEPRGATPATDNTGTAMKDQIFASAVKRLNREIARHDSAERRSAQGRKSRHALELKQAGAKPDRAKPDRPKPDRPKSDRPKSGRTASRGMRSKPSREPTVESPARRERKS